jgi:hypothetical protein
VFGSTGAGGALIHGVDATRQPSQVRLHRSHHVAQRPDLRGLLDAGAHKITNEALVAAAHAIAGVVSDDALSPIYIVPSVFDEAVAPAVADAVTKTIAAESNS